LVFWSKRVFSTRRMWYDCSKGVQVLPQKTPPVLEPSFLDVIVSIGIQRAPAEACGVVIPTPLRGRRVWEMPNRAADPTTGFEYRADDVMLALEPWMVENTNEAWAEIIFWHTHPGGHAYPSRADVENRLDDVHNLVVALGDDGPVPCWF
jgi:proteasome lid subunit RPN8/RPN11